MNTEHCDGGSTQLVLPDVSTVLAAHQCRDGFTVAHEKRVADLAVRIGQHLGIRGLNLEILRMGAMLHDIGKIALPAEILGKPAALTELEYALVREHTLTGFRILQNLPTALPIAEIAYQHHERMDGSGYPRQLKGDHILLEARIIAVADTFDAMTANRAYRPGMPEDFVLGEISNMSGRQLDQTVVAALLHTRLAREPGRTDSRVA